MNRLARMGKRYGFKNRVFIAPADLSEAQRQLLINIFTRPEKPTIGPDISDVCLAMLSTINDLRSKLFDLEGEANHDQAFEDGVDEGYWIAIEDTSAMLDTTPDELHELLEHCDSSYWADALGYRESNH